VGRLGWGERERGGRVRGKGGGGWERKGGEGEREGTKGGHNLRWWEGRGEWKRWHGMTWDAMRVGVGVRGMKTRFFFFFSFLKKKARSNEYEEKERKKGNERAKIWGFMENQGLRYEERKKVGGMWRGRKGGKVRSRKVEEGGRLGGGGFVLDLSNKSVLKVSTHIYNQELMMTMIMVTIMAITKKLKKTHEKFFTCLSIGKAT